MLTGSELLTACGLARPIVAHDGVSLETKGVREGRPPLSPTQGDGDDDDSGGGAMRRLLGKYHLSLLFRLMGAVIKTIPSLKGSDSSGNQDGLLERAARGLHPFIHPFAKVVKIIHLHIGILQADVETTKED